MPPNITDKPVVIVGGGVTGLVAAHLLAEAGIKAIVIEKLADAGGLARSFVMTTLFLIVGHIVLMFQSQH